ncbi:MAG TPA: FAD/NAD(P)-binding protein [Bacteroidota bacterium]|nr:FAD/NAD(P)-binding protein [Bacteroidota bacterium]
MLPHPYLIQRVHQETSDTFTLEIVPADGSDGLTFMPGQFNMLYVFGVGEVPISISGDPGHPHTIVHTTRAVGTVTKAMRQMRKGDVIGIRGPFGTQWPVDKITGSDVVITAGGIGLAPLRPAIYQILNHRERYGKVVLLYGTRSPGDILFRRELEIWRSRFDLEVYITVDRAVGDWKGNVGVITTLIPRAPFDPHKAVALICGPEIMMRYSVKEFQKRGMSYDSMYVSMERNMKCAIGFCGHCQYGHRFICKDGPVFRYDVIDDLFTKREV